MDTTQDKGQQARNRLLAAAEKLFLRSGAGAITVRGVTEEAGLSIAMVNYHFGSRAALVEAMLERRLAELSDKRSLRLQQLLDRMAHGAGTVTAEAVVRAFLDETLAYRWAGGAVRELARGLKDSGAEKLLHAREVFLGRNGAGASSLKQLLHRVIPEVPKERLWWRWCLAMGAMEVAIELWDGETTATERLIERLTEVVLPMLTVPEGGALATGADARPGKRAVPVAQAAVRPRGAARALLDPMHLCEGGTC